MTNQEDPGLGTRNEQDEITDVQISQQQTAYASNQGGSSHRPKKRKVEYTGLDDPSKPDKKEKKDKSEKVKVKPGSIYVQNLPPTITREELFTTFSKCGIILEDANGPRIKIYTNEDGSVKGDALILYLREESVELACTILDGTCIGAAEIKVAPATFTHKPQGPDKTDKPTDKAKKKASSGKSGKLRAKLEDWSDDEEKNPLLRQALQPVKELKRVILRNMFTFAELEDDPTLLIDLKQDVLEECEKLGDVNSITVFDKSEGVMMVSFATEEAAVVCIKLMKGRYFAGRRVDAYFDEGKEKFERSRKGMTADDEAEEEERLKQFGEWLENEDSE